MKYIIILSVVISTIACAEKKTDSLDIKIGQMLLIGLDNKGASPEENLLREIRAGRVGGVIIYEKNIPATDSYVQLKKLIWNLQKAHPVPLFITIDQEGGKVNRLKPRYGFPRSVSAAYLGKTKNLDSTRFYSEITAATLAGLGINVNFAPDVDVAVNPENPIIARVERSFSADPDSVAIHAAAVINAHRQFNILTVLKHFPGHGSSHADTHLGIADVTDYWEEYELLPYHNLIEADLADAIMTAHIVNKNLDKEGLPGTLSGSVINNLLRKTLSYNGLVFSDDMQMKAISEHFGLKTAIELSIKAGVDVLMFSNNISENNNQTISQVHSIIRDLISSGKISPDRIDQSFQRIMKIKKRWH